MSIFSVLPMLVSMSLPLDYQGDCIFSSGLEVDPQPNLVNFDRRMRDEINCLRRQVDTIPKLKEVLVSPQANTNMQNAANTCTTVWDSLLQPSGIHTYNTTQAFSDPGQLILLWGQEKQYYFYPQNVCTAPTGYCGDYMDMMSRVMLDFGCAMAVCHKNSPFPGQTDWVRYACAFSAVPQGSLPY